MFPLHRAIDLEEAERIETLQKAGASLEERDPLGWTALELAVSVNYAEGVEALCNAGADLDVPGSSGNTLLHSAVVFNSVDVIEVLCRRGANLEAVDEHGLTPLYHAVNDNKLAALIALSNAGANLDPKTAPRSPLYVAISKGYDESAKQLIRLGATLREKEEAVSERLNWLRQEIEEETQCSQFFNVMHLLTNP